MKICEIIRIIEADGWRFIRQRGSHRQYRHSVKKGRVTISGHPGDDLTRDIFQSILKQAQIDRERRK